MAAARALSGSYYGNTAQLSCKTHRNSRKLAERETSKLPAKVVGRMLEEDPDIELIGDEYQHKDGSTLKVANLPSRLWDARKRRSKRILG